jgi:hypothetical protein
LALTGNLVSLHPSQKILVASGNYYSSLGNNRGTTKVMKNSESMNDVGCLHADQPGESGVHVLEVPQVSAFLAAGNKNFFESTSHDGTSGSISHQTDPTETLSTSTRSPTAGMDVCLMLPPNKRPYQGMFAYNLYQEFLDAPNWVVHNPAPTIIPRNFSPTSAMKLNDHQLVILFNTSDRYQLEHH